MDSFISDPIALRKLKFIWRESGIQTKYSALSDFKDGGEAMLFKTANAPSTAERMRIFSETAPVLGCSVGKKAIINAGIETSEIDAIVTVSCTGMSAPGLEIQLAQQLGLSDDIERHAINFMGCYAAFHGMRLADMLCQQGKRNVLVVCVELCSLHFRDDSRDDNLLSTTLFSDGAAAMVISKDMSVKSQAELIDFHSVLISEGGSDMAWDIGNTGFEMVLNKHVPKHIERNMAAAYDSTIKKAKLLRSDVGNFAIHPGGKNVLKAFAGALDVHESQLISSFNVLENYGNMSSCSIIFVIEDLLRSRPKEYCYAAAFGPGLTVESALLLPISSDA